MNTQKPISTHTSDNQAKLKQLDLLQFIEDEHIIKKLSKAVSNAYHIPESTVFLMGLSGFSSISCRRYVIDYPDNGCLPIGLYSIAEQPSGVGKSRCLNLFMSKFYDIHKEVVKDRKKDIDNLLRKKDAGKLSESEAEELAELQNFPVPLLYTTNATSAGLESTLATNHGFFAGISSEQGLFNSLFDAKTNDVVLNGFDGGFINVSRSGRKGYSGNVTGAVVCFAQQGSIETILGASNGGLSECFLMLVEPHLLGKRDHTHTIIVPNELIDEYKANCVFAQNVFTSPKNYENLNHLSISSNGFKLITQYKNSIEPYLADDCKYSFSSLRGVAAKINMQIMKIATNLSLLQDDPFKSSKIRDCHIISAINIANSLLEHQRNMMIDKGIIGLKG